MSRLEISLSLNLITKDRLSSRTMSLWFCSCWYRFCFISIFCFWMAISSWIILFSLACYAIRRWVSSFSSLTSWSSCRRRLSRSSNLSVSYFKCFLSRVRIPMEPSAYCNSWLVLFNSYSYFKALSLKMERLNSNSLIFRSEITSWFWSFSWVSNSYLDNCVLSKFCAYKSPLVSSNKVYVLPKSSSRFWFAIMKSLFCSFNYWILAAMTV